MIEPRPDAPPAWRHLGLRVDACGIAGVAQVRGPASFSLDRDVALSTAPCGGLGWFGPELLRARRGGARQVAVFDRADVDATATAITIRLADAAGGVALEQHIALGEGGCFTFSARLTNAGTTPLELDWLASVLLPLPGSSAGLVSWRGRHNAELVEVREPMPQQAWRRESRRGLTGHGGPPGVFVLDEGATRHAGLVHALQLAWSGDAALAVERDDEGLWTLAAGAVLQPGEVVLQPGEAWTAPPALVAVSGHGRNGASAQFHAALRRIVCWPDGTMRPRPVHLNSWEACYFDHDAPRIAALADAAAAIGIERLVLDDGWFRGRNDDTAGLGDWTADPTKYPAGLGPLARHITALGMEFGLWVEPEMVNPDSDLYRAHPDWALALDGRPRPTARNQLVLDLSREDVRDYLFAALDALLHDLPIAYLKWDHNRDLAPAGGARQVEGAYALFARLRAAHPAVEIEACAGGGGRSDAGIAAYVHRFWTSDNIDAASRVEIQRGFIAFLPPEMMGAHVGASPAHATGRGQSMAFRAAVALPGHFGVELDPRAMPEADRAELADWIAFYKAWRHVLHPGEVWLGEGADGLVWQAQGGRDDFLLFAIRTAPPLDRRPQPLTLPFLAGAGPCHVQLLRIAGGEGGHAATHAPIVGTMTDAPLVYDGSWLAHAGLPLPSLKAESVAIYRITTWGHA
ncbi:alpha-galactosidase [Novosphingobium lentum]|uniref:alpha-galactosidase n=1 Tax=Novosphingobium lentum TaxID=145287 RepID=UPI000AD5C662|nr:alpha-galactosidase [Novosphingobium lentum]